MNRDPATGYSLNADWIQPPMAEVNNSTSDTVTRLRHDFYSILSRPANIVLSSSITDTSATTSDITDTTMSEFLEGYNYMMDALSSESITHLHRIAETMSSLSHLSECVNVYKSVRKGFVDTHFRRLMVDNSAAGESSNTQLTYEELKKKIDDWIKAARICITHIFRHEKRVYDQIFQGIGTADTYEAGFIATVKDAYTQLYKYADSLSNIGLLNSHKLFPMLEFYNAVSDLNSHITFLFPPESVRSIKNNSGEILSRLHKGVEKTLFEFENSLVTEMRSEENQSGPIHRSTEAVMIYINRLLKHKKTLNQLIESNPCTSFKDKGIPDIHFVMRNGQTQFGMHMILIIVVLRFNLESKFKKSEGNVWFHLFMMNNIHFIVQHIRGSPELKEMIGDDYLDKLSKEVEEDMNAVKQLLCKEMLDYLKDEGVSRNTCFSNVVSKSVVRDRIKSFNSRVEEVQKCGPSWVVREVQLREKLLNSILVNLLPRYRSFLNDYGSNVDTVRYPDVIRYHTDDELRSYILKNLFA
jgi:exocyst complex protein 7